MKRMLNHLKPRLLAELICFGISALAICAVPLTNGSKSADTVIVAVLFWVSLAAGIVCARLAAVMAAHIQRKLHSSDRAKRRELPGIISFSGQKGHIAIYAVFAVGLVVVTADLILGQTLPKLFVSFMIALTYYFFVLHCVLDGKCYKVYITAKEVLDNGK